MIPPTWHALPYAPTHQFFHARLLCSHVLVLSYVFVFMQVAAKLPRVTLSRCTTVTLCGEDTEAEDQPAALRDALPVIAQLQLPPADTTLELHQCTLTNALAAALAAVTAAGG